MRRSRNRDRVTGQFLKFEHPTLYYPGLRHSAGSISFLGGWKPLLREKSFSFEGYGTDDANEPNGFDNENSICHDRLRSHGSAP